MKSGRKKNEKNDKFKKGITASLTGLVIHSFCGQSCLKNPAHYFEKMRAG
jgi:hypothetical protein